MRKLLDLKKFSGGFQRSVIERYELMSDQEDPILQKRHTYELDPNFVTNCANCKYWRYDSDLERMMRSRYSDYESLGMAGLCTRRAPAAAREIPVMVPVVDGPRLIGDEQRIYQETMTKVLTMSHAAWPWTFGVEGCGEGVSEAKGTREGFRKWATARLESFGAGYTLQYISKEELQALLRED